MINSDLEWWKAQAGRVPLLEPGEEITLGRQVQELIQLEERLGELREEMASCADGAAPGEDQLAQAAGLTPAQLRRRLRAGRRAKDRMITGNLRLVISYVLNLRRDVLAKYSPEDLISAGNEGLIRAVEKFDPQRGYKFSTYAYWWIRQAVTKHQHVNDHIVSQANCRAEHRRIIGQAIQTLTAELRRHPSEAEIRASIIESGRLSAAQISEAVASGRPVMALDMIVGDDTNTLVDLIAAPDTSDPEADELAWRLDHLPPNLRQLTIRSWGLDGAKPWTIPEAALAMGVSRAQISRDRQRAMRLLRLPPQSRPCRPQSPESRPPPETDPNAGWSVIGQESIPPQIAQDGGSETLGGGAPLGTGLDQFSHEPLVGGEELTALHVKGRQTAQPVRGRRHQLIRRQPLDLPDPQLQLPIILNSPSTHS